MVEIYVQKKKTILSIFTKIIEKILSSEIDS